MNEYKAILHWEKKSLKAIPERSKGKMEFTAKRSNIFRTHMWKKSQEAGEKL